MRSVWLCRFAAIALALALALVATPTPAGAQDGDGEAQAVDPLDLHWKLMQHILDELAYFVVLDRVSEPVPEVVQNLPEEWGILPAPESVYEDALYNRQVVAAPVLAERFVAGDIGMSERALNVLLIAEAGPIDAAAYLGAYDDVLWQWWYAGGRDWGLSAAPLQEAWEPSWWLGSGPPPVIEPVVWPADAPVVEARADTPESPADSAADETPPAAEAPSTEDVRPDVAATDAREPVAADDRAQVTTSVPEKRSAEPVSENGWIAYVAIAAVALLGVSALALRRRSARPASTAQSAEQLLEAGRRFLAANSIDELGSHVAESTHRLSAAAGVAFTTDDGSWTSGTAPVFPDHVVDQVRATAKTVWAGEDALVAVLSGGRVVGTIAVAAPGSSTAVVEQLAPLAGEGFANLVTRDATEQLAFVDALTAVPNRRRFDLDLFHHTQVAAGEGLPVAVAMIDVDHFKSYNDTNGHQEGDDALRTVADLINRSLRAEDTVYRYGGEEFAVLLPGADLESALRVAERIRHTVESHEFRGGPEQPGGRVTVSIGVSTTPPPDGEVMLEAADAALYRAKQMGRNQVVLSDSSR